MAKRLYNVDPIERFNQKYIVDEETGCWNWIASLNNRGYGNFHINNKTIFAYRFSYEYFVGQIDPKLIICHNCSNRKCVNPNHLRQDTHKSNMIDMVNIVNQRHQKLSVHEVIEIKKELQNYYIGQVNDLAHFYKVNHRTISGIKTGKSWTHINIS